MSSESKAGVAKYITATACVVIQIIILISSPAILFVSFLLTTAGAAVLICGGKNE